MTTAAKRIPVPATTMIGSLPHHNIDAALEFSFRLGIPFLPQIPVRNAWEYMIAQALEGLPGLEAQKDGGCTLDLDVWHGRMRKLSEKLAHAFEGASDPLAFEAFEPSAPTSSSWQPFLWELEERGLKFAKIQIAGPLTSQASLQFKSEGKTLTAQDVPPELTTQIYRLVLARALGMCRHLQQSGIQPLIYLDEPGLYAVSTQSSHLAKPLLALQELKLMIQTLKKEGALTGLHCCSNTDWKAVLGLGMDYLSLDVELSLPSLLDSKAELDAYLQSGGNLSFGVIPTQSVSEVSQGPQSAQELLTRLKETLASRGGYANQFIETLLARSLYTPACGLALQTPSDAETILETLIDFHRQLPGAS